MELGKKEPVKCNPFCILKAYFSQLVLWQSLTSFLVQRSGDINSKRAQLLPSDHDNREIIHIYSFGKRHAQRWFYSTLAFLPCSPPCKDSSSLCCLEVLGEWSARRGYQKQLQYISSPWFNPGSLLGESHLFFKPAKYLLSCVLDVR